MFNRPSTSGTGRSDGSHSIGRTTATCSIQRVCRELKRVLEETRLETRTRVLVVTGAGDRLFCIGGEKDVA